MSQKLPVDRFEWFKYTFRLNEDFIKIYNKDSKMGYFLESDVQYPKQFHKLHSDSSFLLEKL